MRFLLLWVLLTGPPGVYAQKTITGSIVNLKQEPVAGAVLSSSLPAYSGISDSSGRFSLLLPDTAAFFRIVHPEYAPQTVWLSEALHYKVTLSPVQRMLGVRVGGAGGRFSDLAGATVQTERIGQSDLKKNACCDLAGCFETQGTVQPMTTNIITNSKELRILGLSGVYNQVLFDGIPMMQGLAYTYGISNIPGTLVENIYVSKGSTSVLQGFESVAGQINVLPRNTDKGDRVFLNVYGNSFGETQYNASYRAARGKWSNLTAVHMVQPAMKTDRDEDRFLDLPRMKRYLFFDKVRYGNEQDSGFSAQLGIRALSEQRIGGQWDFNPYTDTGSRIVYGQKVAYVQMETYAKAAWRFSENSRISLQAAGIYHDQHSWFGTLAYTSLQKQGYANLQYEQTWNGMHEFKTGFSLRKLDIRENIRFSDSLPLRTYAGKYRKHETIAGFFAENTFQWRGGLITLITGLRADRHNDFGWHVTPRMMLKYDIGEKSVLRASAGSSWRTVNLFSENIGLLVSSRNLVFAETLRPEKAVNWGINFLQKFGMRRLEGYFTVDFYQTRFQNQFFPDFDSEAGKAIVNNFGGLSVSNGFQTDWSLKYRKVWELKLAYNFLDVYRRYGTEKYVLPFNPAHKVLTALSYLPRNKKWRADFNLHWFGRQRLPDTENYPEEFRQPALSKAYSTLNLQVTRSWKSFEFYGGCENLLDYRQKRPIVSWQQPFGPYFDTSFNWGPTRGREFYLGLRWKLKG